jgi:hypothetical protein
VAENKKNETQYGTVLGKGVQYIKNNPHGNSGWHLLGTPANRSPSKDLLRVVAATTIPLHP